MEKQILLQPISQDPTNKTTTYQFIRTDSKIIVLPSNKVNLINSGHHDEEDITTQIVVIPNDEKEDEEDGEIDHYKKDEDDDDDDETEYVTVIASDEQHTIITTEDDDNEQTEHIFIHDEQPTEVVSLLPQDPVPKDDIDLDISEPPPKDLMDKVLNQLNQDQLNQINQINRETRSQRLSYAKGLMLSEENQWYFSEEVRTDFVVTYLQTNYNAKETIKLVKERHPEIVHRSISRNTPRVLLKKFLSKHTVANQQAIANRNRPKTKITPEVIEQIRQIAKEQSKLPPTEPRDTARRNSLGLAPSTYIRAVKAAGLHPAHRSTNGPRRRKQVIKEEESKSEVKQHIVQTKELQEDQIFQIRVEPKDWSEIQKANNVAKEKLIEEEKITNHYYTEWTDKIERLETRLYVEKSKNYKLQRELAEKDEEIAKLQKEVEQLRNLQNIEEQMSQDLIETQKESN